MGNFGPQSRPTRIRGLHGLRHIFLTEAGGCTHPFTLQYVAGHDSIKTTMRYVHPQANAVQDLFLKLAGLPGKQFFSAEWTEVQGRCKIRCSCNYPSRAARASG